MIESLNIKNYLSFKEEQVISFIASREKGNNPSEQENWFTQIGDTKLLKILIFIGNNGAGKTNALSAMGYLRHVAIDRFKDIEEKPDFEPFMLDDNSRKKPSELSIVYYIDEQKFSYHISVCKDYIVEESLILHDGRKTASVYKRSYDKEHTNISFGNACDLSVEDKRSLIVNTISNSSVLATFGSMNLTSTVLRSNYLYFRNEINMVSEPGFNPIDLLSDVKSLNDPEAKKVILKLLSSVDAKISDYEVKEHMFDLPRNFFEEAPHSVIEKFRKENPDGKFHQNELTFEHHTSRGDYPINFSMESRGTISMIRMIILIYDMIKNRRSSFIDEFSYSVHQLTMNLLMRMFLALSTKSQIVITTQSIAILLNRALRRDSIRICQKSEDGETQIQPINQSEVHKNKNLFKVYLDNDLEGLPFVEDKFDFDEFIRNIKDDLK
ncbi:MAG: ATP-binding protein [Prevotella sp.]|jgi:hypothetical protein|nr:ATP-binding protein [Prevotella sp.]